MEEAQEAVEETNELEAHVDDELEDLRVEAVLLGGVLVVFAICVALQLSPLFGMFPVLGYVNFVVVWLAGLFATLFFGVGWAPAYMFNTSIVAVQVTFTSTFDADDAGFVAVMIAIILTFGIAVHLILRAIKVFRLRRSQADGRPC